MVKRVTFWEIALAASLIVVGCACGLAVAKEKLILKYLPVDHDIEMVRQDTKSILLNETKDTGIDDLVRGHTACVKCRGYDRYNASQCPNCCLYNNNASVFCQGQADDSLCPVPGPKPFINNTCLACPNGDPNQAACGSCTEPCARAPVPLGAHCQRRGCPEDARPNDPSCKPAGADAWYCKNNSHRPACVSSNADITGCVYPVPGDAYDIAPVADSFCDPSAAANSTGHCFRYDAKQLLLDCINNCTSAADQWEHDYYEYANATLGMKICPQGACDSGFGNGVNHKNCDKDQCDKKIAARCNSDYTIEKCADIESEYRESLLGGITEYFKEIDPQFGYSFVARSGEKYMAQWQVLCDVIEPGRSDSAQRENYNLYTMIKIWEQDNQNAATPVYESIVHQKSLGSTFFIHAQTGFSRENAPKLLAGHAYIIKLYYLLPWDGTTKLQVNVSVLQMILYRTKN